MYTTQCVSEIGLHYRWREIFERRLLSSEKLKSSNPPELKTPNMIKGERAVRQEIGGLDKQMKSHMQKAEFKVRVQILPVSESRDKFTLCEFGLIFPR